MGSQEKYAEYVERIRIFNGLTPIEVEYVLSERLENANLVITPLRDAKSAFAK